MSVLEITSMSTKGQIVIPQGIRNELHVESGAKFAVVTDGQNILLKQIEMPKIAVFKNLLKRSQRLIKETGISQTEVASIIKKARRENRS